MAPALSDLIKACVDLVYPLRCASCRRKIPSCAGLPLCPACMAAMRKNPPPFCRRCGRTVEGRSLNRGLCAKCLRASLHFDRAYSPYLYEGPVKALVHELKYRGKDRLGDALGQLMSGFIEEYGINLDFIDCVVPVPLHQARLREREFNQALLLAKAVAAGLKKPLADAVLKRRRNTRSQTELRQEERYRNIEGSFLAGRACVNGRNILLIDDVLTTGATASEAARTLKAAGAGIVFVLTLAN